MASSGFGGTSTSTGHSGYGITSGAIGAPSSPYGAYNGDVRALLVSFAAYFAGYGAARSGSISLFGLGAGFSVGAAGNGAVLQGYFGVSGYFAGGAGNLVISPSGQVYFARGGGGSTSDTNGTSWAGVIGGVYNWVYSPSPMAAPTLTLQPAAGQVQVTFSPPGDNGGAGITFYRIFYWATGESADAHHVDVSGSAVIDVSSFALGKTLSVRVSSSNANTSGLGTVSAVSGTTTVFIPSSGKVRGDDAAWHSAAAKVCTSASPVVWKSAIVQSRQSSGWKTAV